MSAFLPRALGVATAVYSLAVIVRPKVMAGPCGMTEPDGSVSTPVELLVRGIGVRDLAIGAVIATAPVGTPLRLATAARVVSDASDAVSFGLSLPDRSRVPKVVAVSGGWALLNLLGLLGQRRRS